MNEKKLIIGKTLRKLKEEFKKEIKNSNMIKTYLRTIMEEDPYDEKGEVKKIIKKYFDPKENRGEIKHYENIDENTFKLSYIKFFETPNWETYNTIKYIAKQLKIPPYPYEKDGTYNILNAKPSTNSYKNEKNNNSKMIVSTIIILIAIILIMGKTCHTVKGKKNKQKTQTTVIERSQK